MFFLTLCDSVHFVTSDWSSLHLFVETSTSGSRRFKQYGHCSLLVSSCFWFRSHNFSLSSNSPQTDCCFIITIISFYLSCFLSFTNYLTCVDYHFTYTNLYISPTTTISPIRICTKYQRLPFHIYEFVQNIRNHELPGYFQRHLPSCGRNEYMVLFHYHPSGWWISWYQFCCHVMLCTFHGIWMAFKKDLLTLLEDCECGKVYGKYTFFIVLIGIYKLY